LQTRGLCETCWLMRQELVNATRVLRTGTRAMRVVAQLHLCSRIPHAPRCQSETNVLGECEAGEDEDALGWIAGAWVAQMSVAGMPQV